MKLFHLSDLHIGKMLHGFSLLEDQVYILGRILELVRERRPDAVAVAGDIYDKSAPPAEAVRVFDEFLTGLAGIPGGPAIFIISGNHDSQERLDYGSGFFSKSRVYIAGSAPGKTRPEVKKVTMADGDGNVNFYLLPFLRPSFIREIPGMESVKTYEEAVRAVVRRMAPDFSERNVLLTHQFFTHGAKSPGRSDSETVTVGGQDNVDIAAVEGFDYVAAGHIHGPQSVGARHVRYCGSPLKYSVSEQRQRKSVTEVTLGKKGMVEICAIPLIPLRDVRRIEGPLAELTAKETLADGNPEDYVSAVLTDEEELYDPGAVLARCYPNLLDWTVENSRTRREMQEIETPGDGRTPLELFEDFYMQMHGTGLNGKQRALMEEIIGVEQRMTAGGDGK